MFLGVAEDVITHEGEPTVSFMTSPRVGLQAVGCSATHSGMSEKSKAWKGEFADTLLLEYTGKMSFA